MKTLEEQVKCAERELAMRKAVYPRWVGFGKMTQKKMDHEIECMRAVVETLKRISRPDPLAEALNSGDGTYRP
jgi:hypothetical protein